jgi:hypothetical protein
VVSRSSLAVEVRVDNVNLLLQLGHCSASVVEKLQKACTVCSISLVLGLCFYDMNRSRKSVV